MSIQETYLGPLLTTLIHDPYSRPLLTTLIRKNLLRQTYSSKLAHENLFTKTIGHVKSLRKWPVDVLNSIFAK